MKSKKENPIGARVKYYRRRLKLTPLQLSQETHIPVQRILDLEEEIVNLSLYEMQQLSRTLQVKLETLIGEQMLFS